MTSFPSQPSQFDLAVSQPYDHVFQYLGKRPLAVRQQRTSVTLICTGRHRQRTLQTSIRTVHVDLPTRGLIMTYTIGPGP